MVPGSALSPQPMSTGPARVHRPSPPPAAFVAEELRTGLWPPPFHLEKPRPTELRMLPGALVRHTRAAELAGNEKTAPPPPHLPNHAFWKISSTGQRPVELPVNSPFQNGTCPSPAGTMEMPHEC